MGTTSTNAAVWVMVAEQKTIQAENLSKHTESDYLRTAKALRARSRHTPFGLFA